MDIGEQRIWAAQAERLRELESWLAMLIVRHGDFNGSGWEYVISDEAARIMRGAMPRTELAVSCEYDFKTNLHVLTAL